MVLTQTQYVYDADGNTIETITSDRFSTDSTTATGALGTPMSGLGARVYYEGYYYDAAGRLTADVNVGTNGGSAWDMPDSPPARSSTALVTTYSYAADAVQDVALTGTVTGGTFTLTFDGDTTSAIAYNVSDATVESDLEALGDIGSGNVLVTTALGTGWEIRFTGTLAGTYENQLTGNGTDLDGTLTGIAIDTISLGGDAGNVVGHRRSRRHRRRGPTTIRSAKSVQDDPGLHQRRHHRRFQQDHRLHLQLCRRNQPHGRDRQRRTARRPNGSMA